MEAKNIDIYVATFEKWSKLANIETWRKWSDLVLARPKGLFHPNVIADLYELHGWMISMEYRLPNHFPEFQAAFEDFRFILKNILKIFSEYFERSYQEGVYWLEKIDFIVASPQDTLEDLIYVDNYNGAGGYLEDVMIELTCSANHLIELALKNSFNVNRTSQKKVELNYLGGPHGDSRIYVPEFDDDWKKFIYKNWLTADRVKDVVDNTDGFVQSAFIAYVHRKERNNSNLYNLRRPKPSNL